MIIKSVMNANKTNCTELVLTIMEYGSYDFFFYQIFEDAQLVLPRTVRENLYKWRKVKNKGKQKLVNVPRQASTLTSTSSVGFPQQRNRFSDHRQFR